MFGCGRRQRTVWSRQASQSDVNTAGRKGRSPSRGHRELGRGGEMAKKLVIIMANTDPRNGEELGAPIFQASVAAAMEYDVEVICTATAGRLMKKGVAKDLFVKPGSPKSVYDFIREAHDAGVRFYCCSPNLDLFDMKQEDLIPECSGIVGGAYLVEEIMEGDAKVLTY
jgi:predicted peroxiredoxin